MKHVFYSIALLALLSLTGASPAYAHGRVIVGGGVIMGPPVYAYPPYYGYPYQAYPPSYVYAPAYPPAYAAPYQLPPPVPADQYYRDDQGEYCREYTRPIIVNGRQRQGYGHACREQDGSWRIID